MQKKRQQQVTGPKKKPWRTQKWILSVLVVAKNMQFDLAETKFFGNFDFNHSLFATAFPLMFFVNINVINVSCVFTNFGQLDGSCR